MFLLRFLFTFVVFLTAPAFADAPKVSVDIAPVHSLVSQVMQGVGAPDLIVQAKASPHSYALRPSQAGALQEADLVIWIGPELTPWLAKPLETLAPEAHDLRLLAVAGTITHEFREEPGDAHDHDHDHADETDPHAWLDPENARVWLLEIAESLSGLDPKNAEVYQQNAEAAVAALSRLEGEIAEVIEPVKSRPFVTYHDAFQYFEARFGLASSGSVSPGDAVDPSPAQLTKLRGILETQGVECAFSEPQFDDRLLRAASEGRVLRIEVLDPMGSLLNPGPDHYATLLRNMADGFSRCGREQR